MRGSKEPAAFEVVRQNGNSLNISAEKPPNDLTPGSIFNRTALVCSAITSVLGILAMIGWATGMRSLASMGSGSIPQAPGAALAFILLGGTWFFYLRAPSHRLARMSILASALFVLLVSLLNLIHFFTGIDTGIEEFLIRRVLYIDPGVYGAGPMSPVSAASFLLACTAIILFLIYTRRAAGLSGGIASIMVSVNLAVLLGYLYGTPLLYGGETRPVSLLSGVTFLFLSAGLIAAAGPYHFPLRLLVGASVRALLLRSFLLVIFVFALIHAVIYNRFSQLIINEALRTALAILISAVVTGTVVLQLSRTIGGRIEREEAERRKAEEALQRAYAELELRVLERTAELAKANETLQAEIAERRRIEEEREKLYREAQAAREQVITIIESITDAFLAFDHQWRVVYMNQRAEQLLRKKRSELIGRIYWEVFPDAVDTIGYRELHRATAESATVRYEQFYPPLDTWFEAAGYPSRDGINVFFRDITERKRTEERLSFLASIVEFSDDAIIGKTPDGIILSWNSGAQKMYGYSADKVIGRSISIIVPPDRSDELSQLLKKIRQDERIEHFQTVRVRKDGKRIDISLTISPIKSTDGRIIGASTISRDITEQKRAEEERERWTAELARSNAELEQFAYIASHDLQEPLRMISGFTRLLEKRYKGRLDKSADEFIAFIVDGTRRMQGIIEDLLAYSRVGTHGKPFEPANLEDVFNQAVTNLKVSIEENKAQISHDLLPTVMADISQMVQLFQNLISNAIKFRKREEPPRIHVFSVRKRNEWVFSVQDNGIGISSEFFKHLFQIFQREHPAGEYPGTGIGLAICKRIVERHGGRIWAESEPGRGSTFYFTIPERGERT